MWRLILNGGSVINMLVDEGNVDYIDYDFALVSKMYRLGCTVSVSNNF